MATYVVLSAKSGPDKDPDAIFVRDGFSIMAAIFPFFWLLWHRMWVWAAGVLFAIVLAGALTDSQIAEVLAGCVTLAISLFIGLEGRHLYIRKLNKRGYFVASVFDAPDLGMAEALYFQGAPMVFARVNPNTKPVASNNMQGVGIFDSYGGI